MFSSVDSSTDSLSWYEDRMTARTLVDLPSDLVLTVLSFLPPVEVDASLIRVCKILHHDARAAALWKGFCQQTGKVRDTDDSPMSQYAYYFRIPCVPDDFPTIASALRHMSPSKRTITVRKGAYEESIVINGTESGMKHSSPVRIVAVDPRGGVGLVWTSGINEPCVCISRSARVELVGIHMFHSTGGIDIWNGNSAVLVKDAGSQLRLENCSIQSDSGRGVVCVNKTGILMRCTSVHDCAATGVYVAESTARIEHCNIVRNGTGSSHENGVPPGHSGIFVEVKSRMQLLNTLVAGNHKVGLSSVGGARVHIQGCDVVGNGASPVVVDDGSDTRDVEDRENDLQGEVIEMPGELERRTNNFGEGKDFFGLSDEKVIQGGIGRRPQYGPRVEHSWTKGPFVRWYGQNPPIPGVEYVNDELFDA